MKIALAAYLALVGSVVAAPIRSLPDPHTQLARNSNGPHVPTTPPLLFRRDEGGEPAAKDNTSAEIHEAETTGDNGDGDDEWSPAGYDTHVEPVPEKEPFLMSSLVEARIDPPDLNPETLDQDSWDFWGDYLGMGDDAAFDKLDMQIDAWAIYIRTLKEAPSLYDVQGDLEWRGPMQLRSYRRERFIDTKHTLENYVGMHPGSKPEMDTAWWAEAERIKQELFRKQDLETHRQKEEQERASTTTTSKEFMTNWFNGKIPSATAVKDAAQPESTTTATPAKETQKAEKPMSKDEAKENIENIWKDMAEAFDMQQKDEAKEQEKKQRRAEAAINALAAGAMAAEPVAMVSAPAAAVSTKAPTARVDAPPPAITTPAGRPAAKGASVYEMVAAVVAAANRVNPDNGVDPHTLRSLRDSLQDRKWTLGDLPAVPPGGDWDDLAAWTEQCLEWRTAARAEQDKFAKLGLITSDPPLIPAGGDWNSIVRWTDSAKYWYSEIGTAAKEWELKLLYHDINGRLRKLARKRKNG